MLIWEPLKPKIEDILVKNSWAIPVLDASLSQLKAVLKVVNVLIAYFKWMEAIFIIWVCMLLFRGNTCSIVLLPHQQTHK